jgi:hypothetical protein
MEPHREMRKSRGNPVVTEPAAAVLSALLRGDASFSTDNAGGVQDEGDLPEHLPDPLGGDHRGGRLPPVLEITGAVEGLHGGHENLLCEAGFPFARE